MTSLESVRKPAELLNFRFANREYAVIEKAIHQRAAVLGELRTGLRGALSRKYRQWMRYKATVRELTALDDRMLKDIGVIRSDIRKLASREA